jgi:hypothetical protein
MRPSRCLGQAVTHFLLDLATALQGQENLGDGTVFRLIREVQRRHFDPPRLDHEPRLGRTVAR